MDDEAMWDSGTIFVPIPEMILTDFFFLITNSTCLDRKAPWESLLSKNCFYPPKTISIEATISSFWVN
ncbi:transmembrane protein, putative [Medicago truncatula]|uniref:Transmembrane protein, putative n=1 Tax=Medicago truncatula TaxID=3880 RepID=A0A072UL84_MEDTR|nr:transmembrane protein, putative [Medicago truncatula]